MAFALVAAFSFPQAALAKGSPWGAGTSYNAKSQTLTIKSGNHTIKKLDKTVKGKMYFASKLVIKGGKTKLNSSSYLKRLTVKKGKLTSTKGINVSGDMIVSGGVVSISTKTHYANGLSVSGDLTVTGGKLTSKTLKEGCRAIGVYGDMTVKGGTIDAITKGKMADALTVYGYAKLTRGKINARAAGKSSMAFYVDGDLTMVQGTVKAKSNRGVALHCGDWLQVSGGKLSAESLGGNDAIRTWDRADIKPSCLGVVKGKLPYGAQFIKDGITYKIDNDEDGMIVVKVVRGTTAANAVNFGGVDYRIQS